ncbi:MAG: hypothetical protein NTX91_00160 [candidate division SR1 bacterium]|nr:hypothetical protein [candidate division SR1 bacterium]
MPQTFTTEKDNVTIVIDTDIIGTLPELTHEEFIARTDIFLKDGSLLDDHFLIGSGPEIKESDLEEIKENRGAYKINNMFLVYWSLDIEDEKKSIWLADTQWMTVHRE